jgi:hypothetical protein
MATYTAYGLVIEAEFPCPELVPAEGRPDVVIRVGAVPERLDGAGASGVMYQSVGSRFILNIDGVGRYLVSDGQEIRVQPVPGATWSDVRVFLLGSCLGALLHQRGLLALHASAIRTPIGGVLFCGPSGAGKSTLLGAFLQRGYSMLADDVTALVVSESDGVLIAPGFPRTRLWEDAALKLGKDLDGLTRVRAALNKYDVAADGPFLVEPVAASRIYVLSTHAHEAIDIVRLGSAEGFGVLIRQTYRHRCLDGVRLRSLHFKMASAVARRVPVSLVCRPSASYRLNELADAIEADLQTVVAADQP